jgi:hypothetical protein
MNASSEARVPTDVDAADTPFYVLTDGSRWIRPQVAGVKSEAFIYGFSDKGFYDDFCANCDLLLKPYPLVKGYLRNQVGAECDTFIVIDADGPRQTLLYAATVQAVLEAQESRSLKVAIVRRLIFDKKTNVYRKPPEDQE